MAATYLPVARGGMVDQPGTWSPPSPAGGAPVRRVATQPVTLPRQSKLTTSTFNVDSLFRSPQEQSAFLSEPRLSPSSAGLGPQGVEGMTTQQVRALGGWGIDPKTGALAYASPSANPALAAATQMGQSVAPPIPASTDDRLNARAKAAEQAWLVAQQGSATPPKPPVASWGALSQALAKLGMQPPPVGANPGLGQALFGNGQMSPQIPPQGPPPAGIAPTVWAGQSPQVPPVPAARAPIVIGGQSYTPSNGAQSYALKNAAGQINALNRQATATGQTGVYNYTNGVRGTTVNGGSGASAYDQANAAAAARARANASNPSSQSSNSWFNSVTGG